jgi:hypothetical protein
MSSSSPTTKILFFAISKTPVLLTLIATSRGSISIYHAIKTNDCDFNGLEGKGGKLDLQNCNICCSIATKKELKPKEKSC